MDKIKSWIINNRLEAILLATILLVAAFLRLYKIDQYMTFLGDEGRDVIVVRRLLVNLDLILVGPGTSIGNMYLGPLYYYMIAPFLFIANFSPVGPAVMVALLGILTVFFVWFVTREWFGKLGGIVAALLYAISPVVIMYSRSSWNPNIMPFFSLLCIYSIWRVYKALELKWLIVLGFSFAMVLNSHYLGLLLVPVIFIYWVFAFLKIKKESKTKQPEYVKSFLNYSLLGGLLFVLLMSPLVLFDARHGWRNALAIKAFFAERQTTVSARPWTAFPKLISLWTRVDNRLLTGFNQRLASFFAFFSGILTTFYLITKLPKIKTMILGKRLEQKYAAFLLLFFWIFVTLIGFGVYKQEIYDHYFGIIFTAVFILIGGIFQEIFKNSKIIGIILVFVLLPPLIFFNLSNNPLRYPPNNQLQRSEDVANKIIEESKGHEFNLAVIAERNYEGAYQYFLEEKKAPLIMIDPQIADKTITNQLFVVCELPEEKCDPTHDPKAGIANFGWSKIDGEWKVDGVIVYRLVHSVGN
jgi:4-amino-4-deoxy-L-arabinose transferase-like glycosyltransferase